MGVNLNLKRIKPGDTVCLVSPSSPPEKSDVEIMISFLHSLGLKVELGEHVYDHFGFLAGRDENRLKDINRAIKDPNIRAIIATRGGKGAYRIAEKLDFSAMSIDPKLLIGFSDITVLQLAILRNCNIPSIHGAAWNPTQHSEQSSNSFKRIIFENSPVTLTSDPGEITHALTSTGMSQGILIGGNLDMIAASAGWALPNMAGSILLLEDIDKYLGHVDRQLTMLRKSGLFNGIKGVAVGKFTKFQKSKGISVIDILHDHLQRLKVPVLGGLPIGHGENTIAVPLGTQAILDADSGTLTIASPF